MKCETMTPDQYYRARGFFPFFTPFVGTDRADILLTSPMRLHCRPTIQCLHLFGSRPTPTILTPTGLVAMWLFIFRACEANTDTGTFLTQKREEFSDWLVRCHCQSEGSQFANRIPTQTSHLFGESQGTSSLQMSSNHRTTGSTAIVLNHKAKCLHQAICSRSASPGQSYFHSSRCHLPPPPFADKTINPLIFIHPDSDFLQHNRSNKIFSPLLCRAPLQVCGYMPSLSGQQSRQVEVLLGVRVCATRRQAFQIFIEM